MAMSARNVKRVAPVRQMRLRRHRCHHPRLPPRLHPRSRHCQMYSNFWTTTRVKWMGRWIRILRSPSRSRSRKTTKMNTILERSHDSHNSMSRSLPPNGWRIHSTTTMPRLVRKAPEAFLEAFTRIQAFQSQCLIPTAQTASEQRGVV